MNIAVAKYRIEAPPTFAAFAERQRRLLGDMAQAGARLAVLPEYLSLELAAACAPDIQRDLARSLAAIQRFRDDWLRLFETLARDTGLHIQAGTFLLQLEGRYRNRADLFTADGRYLWQDKLQLTGFEKNAGMIDPGESLHVFDIDGIRTGIAVCYDSEFPLPVRAQREAGMRLLLVPSCTDTRAGATRVRIGCLARALENRCYVAQSVTAGKAEWSPALDINTSEAGIYAPMDARFPPDGVLAQTTGEQGWVMAEINPDLFEASRANAQVGIDHDWPGQFKPGLARAQLQHGFSADSPLPHTSPACASST